MFEYFAIQVIGQLPLLTVLGIAFVAACRSQVFRPRTRWSIVCAVMIAAISQFSLPYLSSMLMGLLSESITDDDWWMAYLLVEFPGSMVAAISWGLVLFAVFDRPAPPKFLTEEGPDRDILDSPSGGRY